MTEYFDEQWRNLAIEDQIRYFAGVGDFGMVQTLIRDHALNLRDDELCQLVAAAYEVAAQRVDALGADPSLAGYQGEIGDFGQRWRARAQMARRASNRNALMNLLLDWFT